MENGMKKHVFFQCGNNNMGVLSNKPNISWVQKKKAQRKHGNGTTLTHKYIH